MLWGLARDGKIIQGLVCWLEGVKGRDGVTQTLRELGPWGWPTQKEL